MNTEKKPKKKMTEDEIRMLWWLHESEQLQEKLTKEEVDEINDFVKKSNDPNLWEIDYDDWVKNFIHKKPLALFAKTGNPKKWLSSKICATLVETGWCLASLK